MLLGFFSLIPHELCIPWFCRARFSAVPFIQGTFATLRICAPFASHTYDGEKKLCISRLKCGSPAGPLPRAGGAGSAPGSIIRTPTLAEDVYTRPRLLHSYSCPNSPLDSNFVLGGRGFPLAGTKEADHRFARRGVAGYFVPVIETISGSRGR